jgi:hypothetical protein
MKQQQLLQDEAKTTSGGNHKWKSASKEKGSVTNYGKGVQERYRKREKLSKLKAFPKVGKIDAFSFFKKGLREGRYKEGWRWEDM